MSIKKLSTFLFSFPKFHIHSVFVQIKYLDINRIWIQFTYLRGLAKTKGEPTNKSLFFSFIPSFAYIYLFTYGLSSRNLLTDLEAPGLPHMLVHVWEIGALTDPTPFPQTLSNGKCYHFDCFSLHCLYLLLYI